MARFRVGERIRALSGRVEYLVVDTDDRGRAVASFADRAAAERHADRLEQGPFDWDEQGAWKDPWDEDDDWGR